MPQAFECDDALWLMQEAGANTVSVPAGSVIFHDGDACNTYVLVTSGSIRVQKNDPNGREILLYRVEEGQNCMLTTICVLGKQPYSAEGVAETDVEMLVLSISAFDEMLIKSASFRQCVMRNIGRRISDLMALLEDVAFGRMDVRLAKFLLKYQQENKGLICCTHKQIATELGTVREVISRLLKDFERKTWVNLSRNKVQILDIEALQNLVAAPR
ncbi:Crp/Fnr family transcriptional regulator [Ghiorsea bivora]|uniref:Crp/Fnr family transcriptional regulator n=1 Tax=Ghiorsea bivora TaxID=1485545 RepID=UPI00056FE535|nr:Crp/Fnr family transcriptional regulator [Ghiorsea bivora]